MPQTDPGLKDALQWIESLRSRFQSMANEEDARQMAAYMKNQFPFFGIKSPTRKEVVRTLLEERGRPSPEILDHLFKRCFDQQEREFHYVVGDLGRRMIKTLPYEFVTLFETLIGCKSWWDTVDFLAPKLLGTLLRPDPRQVKAYARKWIRSENFWYQRSAILLQLDYKADTNEDLLYECILRRAGSREFFVQKGAGWALRQYSKVNPVSVSRFIGQHQLPPLTIREGRKWMERGR